MVMVGTDKLLQDCVHTNVSEGQNASIFRVEDENNKHLPTRIHSDIT
jgi:hypothetical protein